MLRTFFWGMRTIDGWGMTDIFAFPRFPSRFYVLVARGRKCIIRCFFYAVKVERRCLENFVNPVITFLSVLFCCGWYVAFSFTKAEGRNRSHSNKTSQTNRKARVIDARMYWKINTRKSWYAG